MLALKKSAISLPTDNVEMEADGAAREEQKSTPVIVEEVYEPDVLK